MINDTNSLYKGGLILLIGFIFIKIGGFVFKIICMNLLPVNVYGEVAIFLVLFNWFVLFATFNVTIAMAKFISQDNGKGGLYYVSSLAGSLALSLVIVLILFLLAPLISTYLNVGQSIIYWAIVSIPFAVIYNIGIFYFRGLYKMNSSVKADVGMMTFRIASLIALIFMGLYFAPFLAFVLSFVIIDIYLVIKNKASAKFLSPEVFSTFKKLLLYSSPIFISEFLRMFSIGIDRLMLSGFYSTVEAGIYDVAVALCLGYIIIASSYSNALLPLASNKQDDTKKRRMELFKALKASTLLFALYTVVVMSFGEIFITIVNPVYLGVFAFLPRLLIAYLMVGFLTILSFYSNSIGKQKYAVYSGIVFAFLSLILNFYLIPGLGYIGAANALVISSFASVVLMGAMIWKLEK